jgi:phage repressor protein C with HTH and peptisase S24 domain
MSSRLKEFRLKRDLSLAKLAALAGTSAPQIDKLEKGIRRMTFDWARRLAVPLGIEPEDLMGGERNVPVVGRVGAGAEILPIDDHAKGEGLFEVECPRGLDPKATVAVEVVGDSMAPAIQEGWVLFYDRSPEPAPSAVVGRLCVVKLEDGRVLVKQVRRGPERGRFNLVSLNGPMIEDVALEWAAPVKAMLPRELVGARD